MALANASAAASSAMSRSSKCLLRAATDRAHPSWWALAIASADGDHAHINGRTSTVRSQIFDTSVAS